MASTNKETPSLLGLPRELRDIIYEYAFSDSTVIIKHHEQSPSTRKAALLCTCKQIYQEGLKTYYRCSIFIAIEHPHDLAWWIIGLPSDIRKEIKHLRWQHSGAGRVSMSTDFKDLSVFLDHIIDEGVLQVCLITKEGETILNTPEEYNGRGLEQGLTERYRRRLCEDWRNALEGRAVDGEESSEDSSSDY